MFIRVIVFALAFPLALSLSFGSDEIVAVDCSTATYHRDSETAIFPNGDCSPRFYICHKSRSSVNSSFTIDAHLCPVDYAFCRVQQKCVISSTLPSCMGGLPQEEIVRDCSNDVDNVMGGGMGDDMNVDEQLDGMSNVREHSEVKNNVHEVKKAFVMIFKLHGEYTSSSGIRHTMRAQVRQCSSDGCGECGTITERCICRANCDVITCMEK